MLLCTGATWPRDLEIAGRQLEGIHFAVSFLEHWQKKQMGNDDPLDMRLMAKDKDVIVIGGGDTGCDCIATSLRQVRRRIKRLKTFTCATFLRCFLYRFHRVLKRLQLLKSYRNHRPGEGRIIPGPSFHECSRWITGTKKSP